MSKRVVTCIEDETNPEGSKVFFTKGKNYDVEDKGKTWEIKTDQGELITVHKGSVREKELLQKIK